MKKILTVFVVAMALSNVVASADPFACTYLAADVAAGTTIPEAKHACSGPLDEGASRLQLSWSPGATGTVFIQIGTSDDALLSVSCGVQAGFTWYCRVHGPTTSMEYLTANFAPITTGIRIEFPPAQHSVPIEFSLGHFGFGTGNVGVVAHGGLFWLSVD